MWKERAEATITIMLEPSVKKQLLAMLRDGKRKEAILDKLNNDSTHTVSVMEGLYEKDANPYIRKAHWEKGLSKMHEHKEKPFFVNIHKFVDPEPKELKEARGMVTADYQNYLEKQWLNKLRKKYNYEVNRDVFNQLKP